MEEVKINANDKNWCEITVKENGYVVKFYQCELVARNINELNEIISKNIKMVKKNGKSKNHKTK